MASAIGTSVLSVPRYLPPKLSWRGSVGLSLIVRTASLPKDRKRSWSTQQKAPFHGGPSSRCSTTNSYGGQSMLLRNPNLRRSFHVTAPRARDHQFDTLKFVQRLEGEGFTEEQSVAMMKVLNDVIEESIQNLTRTMVLREDAAKATYTQKVDFAKLRSELLSADSTEANTTRSAHERLMNDITKLNSRLRDEIGRTQASVRLDLNLEKGRIREEAANQELKIKETETKIEQEVAALREKLEQVKFQTLQWLMGVCTGFAALMLGAWRLLM
ncbi:DUF1640-domain-containing protein [Xylariomycetidae sp. FL2044]|nr:DUF1640-domain-containing protein [Xylariomycetidae sp. FL2044]